MVGIIPPGPLCDAISKGEGGCCNPGYSLLNDLSTVNACQLSTETALLGIGNPSWLALEDFRREVGQEK